MGANVTSSTFTELLRTYAQTHTLSSAANGTRQEPAMAPPASRNQPWYAAILLISQAPLRSSRQRDCFGSGWVKTLSQTRYSAFAFKVHHCGTCLESIAVRSYLGVHCQGYWLARQIMYAGGNHPQPINCAQCKADPRPRNCGGFCPGGKKDCPGPTGGWPALPNACCDPDAKAPCDGKVIPTLDKDRGKDYNHSTYSVQSCSKHPETKEQF